MTPEQIETEKERFNSLTPEEASRIASEVDGAAPALRSCWHCNGAHDHLKDADFFTCFACGISYVRGFPTPILGMRMRGETVDDETMQKFIEVLEESE